jgi:hypothetical protein
VSVNKKLHSLVGVLGKMEYKQLFESIVVSENSSAAILKSRFSCLNVTEISEDKLIIIVSFDGARKCGDFPSYFKVSNEDLFLKYFSRLSIDKELLLYSI